MTHPEDRTQDLKLAYIIGAYPSLTTTFIDREIVRLRQLGVDLGVLSIRRPSATPSGEQASLQSGVTYLLPVSILPFIGAHLWYAIARLTVYWPTLFYLFTRPHPSFKSRLKTVLHFGEGVYAAHLLHAQAYDQLHAHFIDRAATITLVASRLLGIPYSVTAHANDIYVNPILLPEKLSEASFVATCTGYNEEHLTAIGHGLFNHKLACIYHGLDIGKYQPGPAQTQGQAVVLSVGQLREKKGFTFLLKACRQLIDQGYDLACQIVGEGPMRTDLEAQIRQLSLENVVTLCGALPHEEVIEKYRQATIFVLPSVVDSEGGRDGIPNVTLEAMAMEVPVVSTRISGIPEAVKDGINGLLIPPGDEAALAAALAELLDNPDERLEMGRNGRQMVANVFSVEKNVDRLYAEFQTTNGANQLVTEGMAQSYG